MSVDIRPMHVADWCPDCYMGATLRSLDPRDDDRTVRVVSVSWNPRRLHVENVRTGRKSAIRLSRAKSDWMVVR